MSRRHKKLRCEYYNKIIMHNEKVFECAKLKERIEEIGFAPILRRNTKCLCKSKDKLKKRV